MPTMPEFWHACKGSGCANPLLPVFISDCYFPLMVTHCYLVKQVQRMCLAFACWFEQALFGLLVVFDRVDTSACQ